MRSLLLPTTIALALSSIGCGAGSKLAVKHPFPSRSEIDDLAAAKSNAPPKATGKVAAAPEWEVDSRLPPLPPPGVDAPSKTASNHTLESTPRMQCVAREVGAFYLRYQALPTERLRRFIAGACGPGSLVISYVSYPFELTGAITNEQILDEMKKKGLKELPANARRIGLSFFRNEKLAVVIQATEGDDVNITVSEPNAQGNVTVVGSLKRDGSETEALINQGRFGVAPCVRDLAIGAPAFRFECPMAAADQSATIEVIARDTEGLLGRGVAYGVARRTDAPLTFQASTQPKAVVTTPAELSKQVLLGINRQRAAAKLSPVALAAAQSATNTRVAPAFWEAEQTTNARALDRMALGLMAGWDVTGAIRNGGLLSLRSEESTDAGAWLDAAFESPLGRQALLSAEARQVAIGATLNEGQGVGAIVTAYSFFENTDHTRDTEALFQHIAALRKARNLPPPGRMALSKDALAEIQKVREDKRDANAALQNVLELETERTGQSTRGFAFSTVSPNNIPFPPEVFAPKLDLAVTVTHYRPEGSPWAMYLVYLVLPARTETKTAKGTATAGAM